MSRPPTYILRSMKWETRSLIRSDSNHFNNVSLNVAKQTQNEMG